MDEKPAEAVRGKPDSSLVAACRAVGRGRGGRRRLGREHRRDARRLPARAPARPRCRPARDRRRPIPARRGPSVLIDAGANADARAEHLLQFGHMGSIFAEEILDVERPEVRLLSIGEEPEKGNALTLEAHALLAASDLNFLGNVESRELLDGAADVVVTRRLHGQRLPQAARGDDQDGARCAPRGDRRQPRGKLGGLLIRPAARELAAARPGHVRRRVPPRAARRRGDRARQLLAPSDRERHPSGGPRSRARRRRTARERVGRRVVASAASRPPTE